MTDKRKEVAREICRIYNVAVSVDTLNAFAEIIIPCKFLRGQKVIQIGEVANSMFFVESGLVLQHYEKNGLDVTEHISREGDMIINIESFFRHIPSTIEISLLEPSFLYAIPYEALYNMSKTSYDICKLMFAIYEKSLIISQHKADIIRFETAKERYVRMLKENPAIIHRAPLHCIASLLQMTPETLSRVRSQVRKEGYQ